MPKTGEPWLKLGPVAMRALIWAPAVLLIFLMVALVRLRVIGVDGLGPFFPLCMLSSLVPSIVYWRGLDEPSREAHKFAWFWGASCALFIVLVIGFAVMFVPGPRQVAQGWIESWIGLTRGILGDESGAVGFYLGILLSALVLILGYAAVWIGWWARQRIGTKAD